MLKKTLAVTLVHLCFFFSFGQNKLNTTLLKTLSSGRDTMITCLVKGDAKKLQSQLASFSGHFHYSAQNISSVTLPLSSVKTLAAQPYVQRVELVRQKLRVLDDSALRKNRILNIHSGAAPLQQAYTGKGVLIGIIDTGTDINHADFKDSLGNTRIAYLWDQRLSTAPNTPQPYNYGQEWSNAQIDSGLCTHDDFVEMSHGTKVAGVAASNGASAFMYRGVAPKADLITVAIDFNNPGPTITDAVNYILNKATLLGKPVVINLSLGDYFGSHDGRDLQAQLIDNMIGNLPGRALVAAAGNNGEVPFHLGYSVTATDTNFTWLIDPTTPINFQVYADSLDFKNVKFSVGVHQNTNFNYKGNVGFHLVDSVLGMIRIDTLKANGNRLGIIKTSADYSDSLYTLDVTIIPDSINYLWTFETTGSGKLDAWCYDFVYDNLPAPAVFPNILSYKRPDTLQTICTSFQCGRNVITVGNYTDRTAYTDVNSNIASFPGTDNAIFPASSFGPTRDGRIKPEIAASGENVATTGALPILAWLIQNYPFAVTQDSLHMTFGGTSAAAPEVTGFAALYFEKYPNATVQQLRQDIVNCSLQDIFTGSTPNNRWGYGKLDGFAALTCRPDTYTAIKNYSKDGTLLVYPNPAKDVLTIESLEAGTLCITDVLGRPLQTSMVIHQSKTLNIVALANGVYLLTLTSENGNVSTQRFIKSN